MSEDQFANRTTFVKSYWAIKLLSFAGSGGIQLKGEGFYSSQISVPLLYETNDLAEAEALKLKERTEDRFETVEVVVTVIQKPKE